MNNVETKNIPEKKQHKKRGRKPKKILINPTEKIINLVNSKEKKKMVILSLPIKLTDEQINKSKAYQNNMDEDEAEDESSENNHSPNKYSATTTIKRVKKYILNESESDTFYECVNKNKSCSNCEKKEEVIKNLKKKLEYYEKNSFESKKNKEIYKLNPMSYQDNLKNKQNILCHWCFHSFKSLPCIIPLKYFKNKFYGEGYYCSFNCALADATVKIQDNSIWRIKSLMLLLIQQMYEKTPENLFPAHPRECLKIFGGNMEIDEFRNQNIILSRKIKVIKPPLVSIVPYVEDCDRNIVEEKTQTKTSNLRLERKKPLMNEKDTLSVKK